jgi:L-iditol 2-dehydrogenase
MEWYRLKKAPRVLGHEIAGDIVEMGENVIDYKIGERVFVSHHVPCNSCKFCLEDKHTLCHTLHSTNFDPGGFAQYIRIPKINVENGVFKLPPEISYEEGVFIEPLACVVRGLKIANFQRGQSILIIGSGISGLLHIKLARSLGAKKIISVDINPYRLTMAKKMGADESIDAKNDVNKYIRDCNDGQLVDLAVTCTGAPSAVKQAIQSVGFGGTILFFAPTEPGIEIPFPLFDLWNKGVNMVSTYAGSPNDIKDAIELIKSKQVKVIDMITHKYPLKETAKGFEIVSKAQDSIKVIVYPQN